MYCSNCGQKAAGNFCSACGAKLDSTVTPTVAAVVLPDWRNEVRHAELIRHPEVRDRIAQSAAKATWALNAAECVFRLPAIGSPFRAHRCSLTGGPVFGVHYTARAWARRVVLLSPLRPPPRSSAL